ESAPKSVLAYLPVRELPAHGSGTSHAFSPHMKLLPNELPRPRLLTSIEASPPPECATSQRPIGNSVAGFFRNYRNAFLVGTLVSSFLILAATYFLYGRGVIGTEAYFV